MSQEVIVIGGGVTGLLMAQVLAQGGASVTILERATDPGHVPPQSEHIHMLLRGGLLTLDSLLSDIQDDMVAGGAVRTDFSKDHAWFLNGEWKPRFASSCICYQQTRTALQALVRRHVLKAPGIRVLRGTRAIGLDIDPRSGRVEGVEVRWGASRSHETIRGTWVVEASGAGSRMAQWLSRCRWIGPPRNVRNLGLRYSSCRFQLTQDLPNCRLMSIYPTPPSVCRGGAVHLTETGEAIVSVFGYGEQEPPSTLAAFKTFAYSLAQPDLGHVLEGAKPTGPIAKFFIPNQWWWRYEAVSLPKGLLVVGDASCRLDPVFGQGMTLGLLQADALRRLLIESPGDLDAAFSSFHEYSAYLIYGAWLLTGTAGRGVSGFSPPKIQERQLRSSLGAYMTRLGRLPSQSPNGHRQFLAFMHLEPQYVDQLLPRPKAEGIRGASSPQVLLGVPRGSESGGIGL